MNDDSLFLKPVEEVMPAKVSFVNGPLDGTGYIIDAMFAQCLPHRMEFFTAKDNEAGWDGYEKCISSEWQTSAEYLYTGFRPL